MKAIIRLCLIILSFLWVIQVWAQQNVSNSTGNSAVYGNWAKSIAIDGSGVLMATWLEANSATPQIMFSQSFDDGASWNNQAITPPLNSGGIPKIITYGPHVYIVFSFKPNDSLPSGIYLRHAVRTSNGLIFDPGIVQVSNQIEDAKFPSIATFGNFVYVVWVESRTDREEVFFSRSEDFGRSFSGYQRISEEDGLPSWTPSISADLNGVHIAWTDQKGSGPCEIDCQEELHYSRSLNFGNSFEGIVPLTCDSGTEFKTFAPSIIAKNGKVHVAYFDKRFKGASTPNAFDAFYALSEDQGATWDDCDQVNQPTHTLISDVFPNGQNVYSSWRPNISVDESDNVKVTFWGMLSTDYTGPTQIFFKEQIDGIWQNIENLTPNSTTASHPNVVTSNDGLISYIAYQDRKDGNNEVYFVKKEFSGSVKTSAVQMGEAYLTRISDLIGSEDKKVGTLSFWAKMDGGDSQANLILMNNKAFALGREQKNIFHVHGNQSGYPSPAILSLFTENTYTSSSQWHHVLMSWNLETGVSHVYVNDVSDKALPYMTNTTLDYTADVWSIGARPDGSGTFSGSLSELYFSMEYIDFSIEENRRKFISNQLSPVYLGQNGAKPTGNPPIIYLGNSAEKFHINKGTGGDFEVQGSLETAPTSPPYMDVN